MEQSRAVLESVGAERLATITLLQSEVESGRVRGEQVRVMREKLGTLEELLMNLQEEVRTHTHTFTCTHTTCTHTNVHTHMYTHSCTHTLTQLEEAQQESRELEDARQSAECRAMDLERQLVAEKRGREGERREREEKVWELSQKLQVTEELKAGTQTKVSE